MMTKRKPLANINITPLVDVLLILLAILMLAIPMYAKKIPVELPKTSLDAEPAVKQTLKLALNASGQIFLGDKPCSLADALASINSSSSIELYPDGKVTYVQLAKLIDSLQSKKPRDVSLMSQ